MKKAIKQILIILILVLFSVVVSATEHLIPLQGLAKDSSDQLLATGDITVRIYDSAVNETPIYDSGTEFNGTISSGKYDILLGSGTSLDLDNTRKYYMEIDINGEEVVGDATSGREEFWPGSGDHRHTHAGLWNVSGNDIFNLAAYVGIGLPNPGEKLHIADGHILIEGGGETQLMFKRDITYTGGPSGISQNPIFKFGRIIQAGDGDPEVRVLYSDDSALERTVFEFDRKGIVASVKPDVGSHFEGFISGDAAPRFRLNSYPAMQLEMGPGNTTETDVAIRRSGVDTMSFITGVTDGAAVERMVIDGNGRVGIGLTTPNKKLTVLGDVNITGDTYIGGTIYGGSPLKVADGLQLIPQSSPPNCLNGIQYYDSDDHMLYICKNNSWNEYRGPQGLQGEQGPKGDKGDPGPAVNTFAVCEQGSDDHECQCLQQTVARAKSPCTVTSDTGSCSNTYTTQKYKCCVCAP